MKFVGVREAQAQLRGLVRASQKERIILTRHGQPIALLTGVEGRDLEELLLSQDVEFSRLLDGRRRQAKPMVSHATLKAEAAKALRLETKALSTKARTGTSRPRRSKARPTARLSSRLP